MKSDSVRLHGASLVVTLCGLFLVACSSGVKRADIPATADPMGEVARLEMDLNDAIGKNVDVLAESEFSNSKKYLRLAKSSMKRGKDQEDTLEALRVGRGYLEKAYEVALGREQKAEGLFASRQMALKAGAGRYAELLADLGDLDSEVSSRSADLDDVSVEKLAEFQERYVDLERRAVVHAELGKAQAILSGAEEDGAKRKAPETFKKAELSLNLAESLISTNVRNPEGYRAAVELANRDTGQLLEVMTTIAQNGGRLPERTAVKMVSQSRKISGLTSDLGAVAAKTESERLALRAKNEELAKAREALQLQRALEKARAQFTSEEADAYQQGSSLVIRLKQVNFPSGRADLPPTALPLLAKVSEVAKELRAGQIVVEGHTDSLGSAEENKAISEKRADAVATYFKSSGFDRIKIESEGYGFERPIATNKSKEGRAQNRRVDVIITPATTAQ